MHAIPLATIFLVGLGNLAGCSSSNETPGPGPDAGGLILGTGGLSAGTGGQVSGGGMAGAGGNAQGSGGATGTTGGASGATGGGTASGGASAGGSAGSSGVGGAVSVPPGSLCANDSNCSQSQGAAVCCAIPGCTGPCECRLASGCPKTSPFLECASAKDCAVYGGGKICCRASSGGQQMQYCTKQNGCPGTTLP